MRLLLAGTKRSARDDTSTGRLPVTGRVGFRGSAWAHAVDMDTIAQLYRLLPQSTYKKMWRSVFTDERQNLKRLRDLDAEDERVLRALWAAGFR